MKLADNKELYLAYFVITCLLAMFYGSESMEEIAWRYVKVPELEQCVTLKLKDLEKVETIKKSM